VLRTRPGRGAARPALLRVGGGRGRHGLCTLATITAAISAFLDREMDTVGDDEDMRLILNVIWLVFGGLVLAL
jgi:hypothetical protein